MDTFRDYVVRIIATALLCAVIVRFARGSGTVKKMVKLLCGIVLASGVILPMRQWNVYDFGNVVSEFRQDAEHAVAIGEEESFQTWAACIQEGVETYILKKADALNLKLDVEVVLSDDEIPVPVSVMLTGNAAPYAKTVLGDAISQDLNIPKEKQIWITR